MAGRIAFFDCFSGVSGNMVLGALIDAGLDPGRLKDELRKLPLEGWDLAVAQESRGGLAGTHADVLVKASEPHQRTLADVRTIVEGSEPTPELQSRALDIFVRLAEAEARVHGVSVDQVHFHDVGAIDAIVDVVGAVVGLHLLDVERVYASSLPIATGSVESA